MTTLHFHVVENDVGYLPDSDPDTYLAVDDAIQALIDRMNEYLEDISPHPGDMPTRGQPHSKHPWTYQDETNFVNGELFSIMAKREETDLSLDVAENGYQVPIEAGIRVMEISPCAMQECEEHRDEWVT